IYEENLEPGKYQLVETKAPSGYRIDRTPIEFEIHDIQTSPVLLTKENRRVTGGGPSCDSFTVTVKLDGQVVEPNTEITLKSGSTEVIGKTDKDGKVIFNKNDLPVGSYPVYDKDENEIG